MSSLIALLVVLPLSTDADARVAGRAVLPSVVVDASQLVLVLRLASDGVARLGGPKVEGYAEL